MHESMVQVYIGMVAYLVESICLTRCINATAVSIQAINDFDPEWIDQDLIGGAFKILLCNVQYRL